MGGRYIDFCYEDFFVFLRLEKKLKFIVFSISIPAGKFTSQNKVLAKDMLAGFISPFELGRLKTIGTKERLQGSFGSNRKLIELLESVSKKHSAFE